MYMLVKQAALAFTKADIFRPDFCQPVLPGL